MAELGFHSLRFGNYKVDQINILNRSINSCGFVHIIDDRIQPIPCIFRVGARTAVSRATLGFFCQSVNFSL